MLAVILFSYMRPELTQAAIQRCLNWSEDFRLFVSIDGLRNNASNVEATDRKQVVQIAEVFAQMDRRVEPVVWNSNTGLTNHAERIMSKAFSEFNQVISIEEDNFCESEGFSFLAEHSNSEEPSIACAYSRFSHVSEVKYRTSYFPAQWGVALNRGFFEKFLLVRTQKKIDESVVRNAVESLHSKNSSRLNYVVEYWNMLFHSAMEHPSHGDALFQYTAMKLNRPFRVSAKSLIKDLGHTDHRGMHERNLRDREERSHYFRGVEGSSFCIPCERDGSRYGLSRLSRRTYESLYYTLKSRR